MLCSISESPCHFISFLTVHLGFFLQIFNPFSFSRETNPSVPIDLKALNPQNQRHNKVIILFLYNHLFNKVCF